MKLLKKLTLLIFILLVGCSTNGKEEIKWFNNEKEAINFGIENEQIKESDIIDQFTFQEDKFLIFRFNDSNGQGVGIVNIIKKDGKYAWNRELQKVILKSEKLNLSANATLKTESGNKYKLYLGVMENGKTTIETDNNSGITPGIDEKTNIFYYLEHLK
ncbi:hypothetical protein FZC66_14135 [Priestia megaterium]|nr:hypothetical protein FZC66_14135 [Priestia megaterium]